MKKHILQTGFAVAEIRDLQSLAVRQSDDLGHHVAGQLGVQAESAFVRINLLDAGQRLELIMLRRGTRKTHFDVLAGTYGGAQLFWSVYGSNASFVDYRYT